MLSQACPCCHSITDQGVQLDLIHISSHDHPHRNITCAVGTVFVESYPDYHREN